MISVIETRYRGYHFRSRLEARWALFLDCMDARWEYEKEGFVLSNSEHYLPDFWLPGLNLWLEIKGQHPTEEEFNRCRLLRDDSSTATAIFGGLPGDYCGTLFCWDLGDSSGGSSEWDASISNAADGDLCLWVETSKELYADAVMEHQIPIQNGCVRVDLAAGFAKSARFEHGQEPSAASCWES
jgi:hypothetical protein